MSLSERAKVDLDYMADLLMDDKDYMDGEAYGKMLGKITEELAGVIFKNPLTDQWEASDEYLSGNVREKTGTALRIVLLVKISAFRFSFPSSSTSSKDDNRQ